MAEQRADNGRRQSLHGQWSSRIAFVLAVIGSAVGLGNIWKFPYVAGANGGGAFVIVYLLCSLLIGLPIMMGEILIGRRGRRNPAAAFRLIGEEEKGTGVWRVAGGMGIIGALLILSFYSVIAGWSLAYVVKAADGAFHIGGPTEIANQFNQLVGSWPAITAWHTVFMLMTCAVVARGVEKGLERAVQFLVPALVLILLVLLYYSATSGYFAQGAAFLFRPDFAALTGQGVLAALGQSFFSLSVGFGVLMAYGAYLPQEASIGQASVTVVIGNTLVSLLAALVIFPVVFAYGLDPAEGPGLVFQTLPLALAQMPAGGLFGTLFFILLTFAAWTSAISVIEPAVAWLMENSHYGRIGAVIIAGLAAWLVGLLTVFSFNVLADFTFWKGTLFDNIDNVTSNILLPLGGLFVTLFAGWVMSRTATADELDTRAGLAYRGWRLLVRYLAPVAVVFVFLNAMGVFG